MAEPKAPSQRSRQRRPMSTHSAPISAKTSRRSSSSHSLNGCKTFDDMRRSNGVMTEPISPKALSQRSRQRRPISAKSSRRSSATHSLSSCKTFDDMKLSNSTFIAMMKCRKSGIQRVKATMRSRNCDEDEVFAEAISLPDKSVFVHLLQQLVSQQITLKVAAKILPDIRFLLSHKNSIFVDTALDILDESVIQLKDLIKQGIALNAQSNGVDIAAEELHQSCIKCKEALTEIYVNTHFITARLDEEQHLYFNSIVEKVMDLVL
uniref:Katanin p80 subunit C-terminal domain-containing protein n=1 Tax=Panagrolaimus sp. ES5 TaxID=591445 RepID=A0AC34FV08_9BILA